MNYDQLLTSWAECRDLLSKERAASAELREALRAQMDVSVRLMLRLDFTPQDVADCTSQANRALAMPHGHAPDCDYHSDQINAECTCGGIRTTAAVYEQIGVGMLCRTFGISAAEAKRAIETIGFMYRQRA